MIHSNVLTVQERFWSKVDFNGPVPEIADRLLAELSDLRPHELQLPYAKAKLALADIHARLAGCSIDNQATERN